MKKLILILTLLGLTATLPAQVAVGQAALSRKGRVLTASFVLQDTDGLKGNHKLTLTPYLFHEGDTAFLPSVEVFGRTRYKRERQEQALAGHRDWTLSEGQLLKGDTCRYAASTPYLSWMRTASLGLQRRVTGCGCDCLDGSQTLLSQVELYVKPVPVTEAVADAPDKLAVTDTEKRYSFEGREMRVFYPVGQAKLDARREDNRSTLDLIVASVRKIDRTDSLRLQRVEITGYASPEGPLALNTRLAQQRAEALRDYIKHAVAGLTDRDFNLTNGVESWSRLREMVSDSDMPHRDKVLQAIDSHEGNARKTALKRIDGGKAYRYILKNFYPELRNACYIEVFYCVMTDVAADAINAANTLIHQTRYAEALESLQSFEANERAWNAIGVCHLMLEHEDEAVRWLRKAAEAGSEAARKNLMQIE